MILRASGQTSLWCLGTKTTEESLQRVLHMSVALFHWCSLPRKGIDQRPVSCSQHVAHADGSCTRPLRCLSGVRCKSHAPFGGGCDTKSHEELFCWRHPRQHLVCCHQDPPKTCGRGTRAVCSAWDKVASPRRWGGLREETRTTASLTAVGSGVG